MTKSVRLYIGNSKQNDELEFRHFRKVENPEDYTDLNIGEKIVVNGIKPSANEYQIVGTIKDILNDPEHGYKNIYISLKADDFTTAIKSGKWTLI